MHEFSYPPLILLMGPTAVGKTAIALELAAQFPVEIISVDSAMIYRGMDIGTGKPSAEILKKIPHRLIDIREINESYSAAEFRRDALNCIEDIYQRGKIPLLVGGTMLYFKTLVSGINELPSANEEIRRELAKRCKDKGLEFLHQELQSLDPIAAQRIHPNDPQRIMRALEVHAATGMTLTQHFKSEKTTELKYPLLSIAVMSSDRAILHNRIEKRFYQMLADGFVDEVRELNKKTAFNAQLPAFKAVGYRQILAYLRDEFDYALMQQQVIFKTRQFAKRQLTWLRQWPDVHWIESEDQPLQKIKQLMNNNYTF